MNQSEAIETVKALSPEKIICQVMGDNYINLKDHVNPDFEVNLKSFILGEMEKKEVDGLIDSICGGIDRRNQRWKA